MISAGVKTAQLASSASDEETRCSGYPARAGDKEDLQPSYDVKKTPAAGNVAMTTVPMPW